MPNLNQVNLIGHVTRPPEVRYTPNGKAVAEIGLAVNRKWNDSNDKTQTEVCFVEVTAWARLAEICAEYLRKGDPVFFTGRLKLESWIDKDQQKRSKLVVVAEQMQLLTKAHDQPSGKDPRGGKHVPAAVRDNFPNAAIVAGQDEPDPTDHQFGGQPF